MDYPRHRAVAVALALALAACVNGTEPTGVGVPRSVSLAAVPRFAVVPSAAVIASLDRARVTLTDVERDSVIASADQAIDPNAEEWAFEFTLQLIEAQVLELRLDIELIDTDPATAVVEYAGRSAFPVQASYEAQEIREINLGRGPLENLSLTSLRLGGARSRIQEGGSDALTLDTIGAAPGQIIFFESTDPAVASVDSAGNVKALVPGNALIIARGGRVADTLDLTVGQVNLPSAAALEQGFAPQSEYVTSDFFVNSLADKGAGAALRQAMQALTSEMLAGHGPQAVGRFEESEALYEQYGAGTNLRLLDGPQLGVILITLLRAADALGIDFQ